MKQFNTGRICIELSERTFYPRVNQVIGRPANIAGSLTCSCIREIGGLKCEACCRILPYIDLNINDAQANP
jgi:hypothetical protein